MGNRKVFKMVIYEFGAWLIILFLLAHAILIADAASQGKSPLHFSELEGRHVLTDVQDCPTYAAGIVYDPLECGHTELFDIDNVQPKNNRKALIVGRTIILWL